jgi:hypothetical protein
MKVSKTPAEFTMANCTLTSNPVSGEAIGAVARALEANARAIEALANQITRAEPLIVVGQKD